MSSPKIIYSPKTVPQTILLPHASNNMESLSFVVERMPMMNALSSCVHTLHIYVVRQKFRTEIVQDGVSKQDRRVFEKNTKRAHNFAFFPNAKALSCVKQCGSVSIKIEQLQVFDRPLCAGR